MPTPRLVALIDEYKQAHGVPDAELARRIGISRQNLSLWRTQGFRGLPDRASLDGVAGVTGRPYRDVLEAALYDAGYLHETEALPARMLRLGDVVTATRGNGHRTLRVVAIGPAPNDWGDLRIDFVDTATGDAIEHPNTRGDDIYQLHRVTLDVPPAQGEPERALR